MYRRCFYFFLRRYISYHGIDVSIIYCERRVSPRKIRKKFEKSRKYRVYAAVGCIDNDGNGSSKNTYGSDFGCDNGGKSSFFSSSPHAELMRRRNNIIFNLVESEREYVHQLEILVANYVRPFRMGKQKATGRLFFCISSFSC